MRAAFGLVSILGFLVAVIYFWSYAYLPYTQQVLTQGQSAQTRVQQMAGIDTQLGGKVEDHLVLAPVGRGGKFYGLQVKNADPGSIYTRYYGLNVNDVIEQIGPQFVREMDEQTAQALATEAYQRKWELVVVRNGSRLSLPQTVTAPLPQPVAQQPSATAQPPVAVAPSAQPVPPVKRNISPLQRQLDAISNRERDD